MCPSHAGQREIAQEINIRLRSAVGERKQWSADGETDGTESERNAAAEPQTEASANADQQMQLVTKARLIVVKKGARGIDADSVRLQCRDWSARTSLQIAREAGLTQNRRFDALSNRSAR